MTVRKRSCGKVMFSQACVNNSVYIRGDVYTPRQTPLGQTPPAGQTPPWADTPPTRRHTPCQADSLPQADTPCQADTPLGRHPTPCQADTPLDNAPPRWLLQYASYWNAFLFVMVSFLTSFRGLTCSVILIQWRDTVVLTFAPDQKKFTSVLSQNTRRCRTQKVFIIKSTRKIFQF